MKKMRLSAAGRPATGFRRSPDPLVFIAANLHLLPVPSLDEISLYTAHPASGLWRLAGQGGRNGDPPPYWAYRWAGGTVLARHILTHPETVAGRRILDLGTGSGIVAIAAMKSGAAHALAADTDPNAIAAARLNAAANGVEIETVHADLLDADAPAVELILAGDLFYDEMLAGRVMDFLDRCRASGIEALIGDPGRAPLPRERLRLVAEYAVADFGDAAGRAGVSGVFSVRER
ncbi:class I SAM-dependent methyltransferase [Rhizobium binxianense]